MRYTPVEYKKGRPREGDGGRELRDADRVQLMLQILLLRENGFPSEEGMVFYKETRQRVTFRPTENDEAWARGMVAEAREAQLGPMPAPLVHSPKCPRCSLVSICLPDETRLLGGGLATELPSGENQLELGLMEEGAAEAEAAVSGANEAEAEAEEEEEEEEEEVVEKARLPAAVAPLAQAPPPALPLHP